MLSELGALVLLSGADFLSVLGAAQLDGLAFVLLRLHNAGLFVARSSGACGFSRSRFSRLDQAWFRASSVFC